MDAIIERKKQLERAKNNIKKHFVGIDKTIDEIFQKMEIWYVWPTFTLKPTIICLWGITGIGKTDLVRRISKELNLADKFVDLQMDNYNTDGGIYYKSKSISGRLYDASITSTTTGILLLDEIQRYRTIYGDQDVKRQPIYDDIWKLLSDGNLTDDADRIDYLSNTLDRQQSSWNSAIESGNQERVQSMMYGRRLSKQDAITLSHYMELSNADIQMIWNYKMQMRGVYATQMDQMKVNNARKKVPELLKTLGYQELVALLEYKINEIENAPPEEDSDKKNHSNLLIFISGNLDNVYFEKDKDYTLTEFSDKVNSITKNDVKKELLTLFRPEHVSRFGNNHIIYKSLVKEDFETLIDRELSRVSQECITKYGITVHLNSKSLKQRIFDEGVHPTQGLRPLFTTISSIIGEVLPPMLVKATVEGLSEISYND